MALSSGLKANHTMRCLDLNIPPGDDEFARSALTFLERLHRHADRGYSRMCRDILNSCVRNTEEAEKNIRNPESGHSGGSKRSLGKGVWGMIEDSELAKTIRQGNGTSVSHDRLRTYFWIF